MKVAIVACVSVLTTMLAASHARAADIVTKASTTVVMTATRYADKYEGRITASGTTFRHSDPTTVAAGPSGFPMRTRLLLTNTRNGRTLRAVVRDRGRFGPTHLDLSKAGVKQLGFTDYAKLNVTVIK